MIVVQEQQKKTAKPSRSLSFLFFGFIILCTRDQRKLGRMHLFALRIRGAQFVWMNQ